MHRCSPREKGNQIFECRFTTPSGRSPQRRLFGNYQGTTAIRAFE
ncbi:hypothetical protein BSU04_07550 [Caballeronia sordidicola]|uniref:Uncharacterized protein n=1 Tax=Caballeronia sordidicola TaxID=196367 RepID=A0A226X777_CABSO|nr:hypothetical protein BSU04_07550 [Caballeronia sordidicola]